MSFYNLNSISLHSYYFRYKHNPLAILNNRSYRVKFSINNNNKNVIKFFKCNNYKSNSLSVYFFIILILMLCSITLNNAHLIEVDNNSSSSSILVNNPNQIIMTNKLSTLHLNESSLLMTNSKSILENDRLTRRKLGRRRRKRQRHNNHHHHHNLHHSLHHSNNGGSGGNNNDLSLWIDETQVRMFSGGNNGFPMEIQAIADGHVLPYILDPNFENYLPVIPSEVGVVNFTWRAGDKKYFYNFDRLQSFDEDILLSPIVSIETRGKIPKRAKSFSVFLPCSGLKSGIASFTVGLLIETRKGKPLNGTPLRLKLRKECFERNPDTECNKKCGNGGWCNNEKTCQCKEGYMGRYCETALCYPQCMNGGTCIEPGKCSCLVGFHGQFCEGGICRDKCLNNGKCVQKDTCECTRGYYGLRCEYSKCMIPCLNGGRCRGVNTCRCPSTHSGDHCEIELTSNGSRNNISPPNNNTIIIASSISERQILSDQNNNRNINNLCASCRNGICNSNSNNKCICFEGWAGKRCQKRSSSLLRGAH